MLDLLIVEDTEGFSVRGGSVPELADAESPWVAVIEVSPWELVVPLGHMVFHDALAS